MTTGDVFRYIQHKLLNDPNLVEKQIRFYPEENKLTFYVGENPTTPTAILFVTPHFENENKFKIRICNVPEFECQSMFVTFIDGEPTWDLINNIIR